MNRKFEGFSGSGTGSEEKKLIETPHELIGDLSEMISEAERLVSEAAGIKNNIGSNEAVGGNEIYSQRFEELSRRFDYRISRLKEEALKKIIGVTPNLVASIAGLKLLDIDLVKVIQDQDYERFTELSQNLGYTGAAVALILVGLIKPTRVLIKLMESRKNIKSDLEREEDQVVDDSGYDPEVVNISRKYKK